MYLDKIYSLQTGVSLEVSTIALRDLIRQVIAGQRLAELTKICATTDLYDYLTVIVHQGAEGLIIRRQTWVNDLKGSLLAGLPVSYRKFDNLFWRNLDEEDPDGDEWYRLTSGEEFRLQLNCLLDIVRSAKRSLPQKTDVLPELNIGWA